MSEAWICLLLGLVSGFLVGCAFTYWWFNQHIKFAIRYWKARW